MIELFIAVAIYLVVFGIDYMFYAKQKGFYEYVSRRTYLLFMSGQFLVIYLFYDQFKPFIESWSTELTFMSVFAGLLVFFTYQMTHDRVYVCDISSRTMRCLTPGYVLVKGSEIVFQQLVYLAIALSLTSLFGIDFFTYIVYIGLLLLIHIIVILGNIKYVAQLLTFGLFAITAPTLYVFTELQLFWPAVYIHGIMYIFYWLMYADFDVQPLKKVKTRL